MITVIFLCALLMFIILFFAKKIIDDRVEIILALIFSVPVVFFLSFAITIEIGKCFPQNFMPSNKTELISMNDKINSDNEIYLISYEKDEILYYFYYSETPIGLAYTMIRQEKVEIVFDKDSVPMFYKVGYEFENRNLSAWLLTKTPKKEKVIVIPSVDNIIEWGKIYE